MKRLLLITCLAVAFVPNVASQSGRRGSSLPSTPTAPIQPPLTPEPESSSLDSYELLFLPESFRDREIQAIDKGTFRIADFLGKVVVINIWASWCGPCRREIPEYEKVRKSYVDRDVEFIALTTETPDVSTAQVNKFLSDVSFGFRLGWADRETVRLLMNGRESIPQTFVVDAEGRIVKHWNGYTPGKAAARLRQAIDLALHDISAP